LLLFIVVVVDLICCCYICCCSLVVVVVDLLLLLHYPGLFCVALRGWVRSVGWIAVGYVVYFTFTFRTYGCYGLPRWLPRYVYSYAHYVDYTRIYTHVTFDSPVADLFILSLCGLRFDFTFGLPPAPVVTHVVGCYVRSRLHTFTFAFTHLVYTRLVYTHFVIPGRYVTRWLR